MFLTIGQFQLYGPILVSHNRYGSPGEQRSKSGVLDPVDFQVQLQQLFVYVPNSLRASEDLVKERVGEGFGLIRSDIRALSHALPEAFQDSDFLLTCALLRLEVANFGSEVADGVRRLDFSVSIESALNDEEFGVTNSVYTKGVVVGDIG